MDRTLYVRLEQRDLDELRALADRELRDTRSQAVLLIREGLRRAASAPARRKAAAARQ